ncbi:MAG: extracellular solute-binding protein [Hydrogenophaga sp.]|nr:extracellular solute-binding protein [Hydrogenophaga sp.]
MQDEFGAADRRTANVPGKAAAIRSPGLLDRRSMLFGAAGLGAVTAGGLLSGCSPGGGAASGGAGPSLKVTTYGGNFEQAMAKYVYPAFTEATGIRVESAPQPAGVQFLLQLIEANKAGMAPMDLCITASQDVLRGRKAGLWKTRDPKPLTNLGNLPAEYVARNAKGEIDGVGAVGWFLALVVNPSLITPLPDSWTALWAPGRKDAWGLSGGAAGMWEITAATYFGGTEILNTEDGIRKVAAKMAELKPNTRLWWDSEGTMQTALENGEVKGGTYFTDVAATLEANGTPIKTIFPKEGPLIDYGCWCQPTASTKVAEADAFINFICSAEAQSLIGSKVNAPPLIRKELLKLTPEEFAKVTSEVTPIPINLEARTKHLDFMVAQFNQMAAG